MVAENGRALWGELKTHGGLDLRRGGGAFDGYDVPLEDRLNELLFSGKDGSLDDNLLAEPLAPEPFLAAFFKAQRPFSMMLRDVLGFFEKASAQYGSHNLKIAFNFEKGREFALDLDQFREWERFVATAVSERSVWKWSTSRLWQLTYSLIGFLGYGHPSELPAPQDERVRRWVEASRSSAWHDPPRLPLSGDASFDPLILRSQRLLDAYHSACRAIAADRPAFMEIGRRATSERDSPDPAVARQADYIFELFQPETDFWATTFTQAVAVGAEQISDGKATPTAAFVDEYHAMLDQIDRGTTLVEEMREALRELLSLPIWQRRHELYAVWVGSNIASALDDLEAVYHTEEGVLQFPFSGAQLATFITPEPRFLMFWTELRSRLTAKSRVGRKNIQPDYRIVRLPFDPVRNSILIVECKQYRRSSLGEFSNAVNDYARGCPNATIILVNNGPIGATLSARIDTSHAGRTRTVAEFRPDNPQSLRVFRTLVRHAVLGALHPDAMAEERGHYPVALRLAGNSQFNDLDLMVRFTPARRGEDEQVVSFMTPGVPGARPGLYLERDVQSGPGEELVRVTDWAAGSYDVFVYNFSDTRSPGQAGVAVTVHHPRLRDPLYIDGDTVNGAEGRWWHVCTIDGLTGAVKIVGSVGDFGPIRIQ